MASENKPKTGNYRWTICALVFFATTVNYVDRNVLGQLKDTLLPLLRWEDNSPGNKEYSWVVNAFQISYALGLLVVGRWIDKLGSKKGYGVALTGWSFAAIGHAFSFGFLSFAAWRAALGVTEAGNFPAAQKTVSEWFPKKERALATGIYNSGTNIGAILAPIVVPLLAAGTLFGWSWQWAFVITGAVGLVWLFFWVTIYKSPAEKLADGKLSQAEYDYIHSDADEQAENSGAAAQEKVPWLKLLSYRQTWAFFFGKFFTDPVWWFYLFWLPGFLSDENKRRILEAYPKGVPGALSSEKLAAIGVQPDDAAKVLSVFKTLGSDPAAASYAQLIDAGIKPEVANKFYMLADNITLQKALSELTSFTNVFSPSVEFSKIVEVPGLVVWPVAVAVVYTISVFGSIFGGYLPKRLADSGVAIGKARKSAMFIYALFPLTVLAAMRLGDVNIWLAILTIGIGTAAHQAWSANIFTTVPDMFPKKAVGSVTGIGGMAGTLGSFLFTPFVGLLLDYFARQHNLSLGYAIVFVYCAIAYLLAWIIMHIFAPRFEKITDL
ncbi:MAG: MFS transporter [Puniceicoccales bacterium]|jgi:ACS family hexuronate transporter-like MFS transporter|nr:MFS transporter [Puniceicoccales bacterium]